MVTIPCVQKPIFLAWVYNHNKAIFILGFGDPEHVVIKCLVAPSSPCFLTWFPVASFVREVGTEYAPPPQWKSRSGTLDYSLEALTKRGVPRGCQGLWA